MGGGSKPQGTGLMSQFHCHNGGTCAHCGYSLTHQLTVNCTALSLSAIDLCLQGPHGILTDEQVSSASVSCEKGHCDPGV